MKRTLLIASIIELFMVTTLDLEARHKRNGLPRLDRHEGNYREIRELEQEIDWLARRNDYLRNQLY
jgi:hypothetical protein